MHIALNALEPSSIYYATQPSYKNNNFSLAKRDFFFYNQNIGSNYKT
jgi:hypothetical protein